jgi:transposase InsO family protein
MRIPFCCQKSAHRNPKRSTPQSIFLRQLVIKIKSQDHSRLGPPKRELSRSDIAYVPIGRGFLYLVVLFSYWVVPESWWASRAVLACNSGRLVLCLGAGEGIGSLRQAGHLQHRTTAAQFTGAAFTGTLIAAGIRISMDGRGRWINNVFIERLWRSLKHEDIYLKGYADGREAHAGIAYSIAYNRQRPHQALGNRTPMAVWREGTTGPLGDEGQRKRVAHMPTAAAATATLRKVG